MDELIDKQDFSLLENCEKVPRGLARTFWCGEKGGRVRRQADGAARRPK